MASLLFPALFPAFTRTAAPLLGLATLAALALAAQPAAAQTTISFDNLTAQADSNGGSLYLGSSYSTQGFTFVSGSNGFFAESGADPVYGDGETSLYSNLDGSTTLTQDNGMAFSLNAIDLGPFRGNSFNPTQFDGPVLFTGTQADGTTVTATETIDDPNGQFQTIHFTGFDNLPSLTFQGNSSPGATTGSAPQFDNVVLNAPATAPSAAPEPSQMAGLGVMALGLSGLLLRARKRKAVAG